ncbi:hypothetical protein DPX16_21503 [Anabarilius grahami]|uniref:Uncharacterized protein n=1 Tax=Anabarilius grahami TaxID=495550 RepID=A0A3N0XV86_ANAGA|nr:hypothetical protein DPX16_21503 [Anabarilius grahami]
MTCRSTLCHDVLLYVLSHTAKGLRGGLAAEVSRLPERICERTRIGIHLRAVTDPQRRRIADPLWLRAASALHPQLKPYLRGGSVWEPQIDTTVTVKARARLTIRHGSAQDPLIDSRIYAAADHLGGAKTNVTVTWDWRLECGSA